MPLGHVHMVCSCLFHLGSESGDFFSWPQLRGEFVAEDGIVWVDVGRYAMRPSEGQMVPDMVEDALHDPFSPPNLMVRIAPAESRGGSLISIQLLC